ncbi:MAG TPA: tetratricopeptide repeat protein [Tepidisphaeraceae bacterium]|nr:tetratricopeptide repeat protein [Tepidisphaeraceae bacterium]
MPLLLFSVFLFGYAAYLFIDPKPGPSVAQKIEGARGFLKQQRPQAAIEPLGALLGQKLQPLQEGAVRVLMAEAIEQYQKQKKISIAANHHRIIENTKIGLGLGIEPDVQIHRRLAESYEALGRSGEAIIHYKQAMMLDPKAALAWQRHVIDLQLTHDDLEGAAATLEDYLKQPELAKSEQAWAKGEMAHVMVEKGQFREARQLLGDALELAGDSPDRGQFYYWQGYSAWKLGDATSAEKYLRVARDELKVQHPLDADAAWLLGRINLDRREWSVANSFFAGVMQTHSDSRVAPLSKIGRGVCRIALGNDEAGLSDLQDVVKMVREKDNTPPRIKEELAAGLMQASNLLASNGNLDGAVELMAYEQEVQTKVGAEFFGRLAKLFERHADKLDAAVAEAKPADRAKMEARVRESRAKAGDAYIAYSRALTMKDDKGYGQALWKGIELYDVAGDLPRAINALETFVNERPDDEMTPDALLRLGQSYQAAGLFDKAIAAYRHNQFRYPKSLAASKSLVPMARAHIAKGPDEYGKAESVLRSVVEDNKQVTPDAVEFRESLMELASLYYRTAQYEKAISRLEEMTQRYPGDERMGQMFFLMGDSYRKSAVLLETKVAAARSPTTQPTTQPVVAVDLPEAAAARTERLEKARELYDRAIEFYRRGPVKDLDKLYLKLAYFYRADCVYDLGKYPDAIKLYGEAAFAYKDDPSAVAAYVQIINANVAMGNMQEAKAANERAKWMLRRMPGDVFSDPNGYALPKASWEGWLKWAGDIGMWK